MNKIVLGTNQSIVNLDNINSISKVNDQPYRNSNEYEYKLVINFAGYSSETEGFIVNYISNQKLRDSDFDNIITKLGK